MLVDQNIIEYAVKMKLDVWFCYCLFVYDEKPSGIVKSLLEITNKLKTISELNVTNIYSNAGDHFCDYRPLPKICF